MSWFDSLHSIESLMNIETRSKRAINTQNWKQLKFKLFWVRLTSFSQLGLINDPHEFKKKKKKKILEWVQLPESVYLNPRAAE